MQPKLVIVRKPSWFKGRGSWVTKAYHFWIDAVVAASYEAKHGRSI
jgi:hypothetical protein